MYFETNWVVGFVEEFGARVPGLFSFEVLSWIDVVGKERVEGDCVFLKRVCAKLKGRFELVGAPAAAVPLAVTTLRYETIGLWCLSRDWRDDDRCKVAELFPWGFVAVVPAVNLSIDVKLGLNAVVAWPPESNGGLVVLVPPNLFPNELCVDVPEIKPVELDGFSFNYLLRYVIRSPLDLRLSCASVSFDLSVLFTVFKSLISTRWSSFSFFNSLSSFA